MTVSIEETVKHKENKICRHFDSHLGFCGLLNVTVVLPFGKNNSTIYGLHTFGYQL